MPGPRQRILKIISMFEQKPAWTVQALAVELGVSSSSIYRDVQILAATEFLSPEPGSTYVLGPAFIRFDALIRHTDPLTAVAKPLMRELLEATTQEATAVLSRRFRDCVMCVHQEEGDAAHAPTSYERGVAMSPFRGATSKAILAHSGDRALRTLYRRQEAAIRSETNCANWPELRDEMKRIREQGFVCTESEVTPGLAGVAVPIIVGTQAIAGLSLVTRASLVRPRFIERSVRELRRISAQISHALDAEPPTSPDFSRLIDRRLETA